MAQPVKISPEDHEPKTIATPEGDNEAPPDQPLTPSITEATVEGLEAPRGNAPDAYRGD